MSHQVKFELGNYVPKLLAAAFDDLGWKTTETPTVDRQHFFAKNPTGFYDIHAVEDDKGGVKLNYDADIKLKSTSLGADFRVLKRQYQMEVAKAHVTKVKGRVVNTVTHPATGVVSMVLEVTA